MTRQCPPELGRRPVFGELMTGRPMCQAHYCGWCCGCGLCQAADKEWARAVVAAPRQPSSTEEGPKR